jgi:hypothetical protein
MTERDDTERISRLVEAFRAVPLEERQAFLDGLSPEDRAAVLDADAEVPPVDALGDVELEIVPADDLEEND